MAGNPLLPPIIPGQLPATLTNDNATFGKVGEYLTDNKLIAAQVPILTGVPTQICTITLTPGDWDMWGQAWFIGNASTIVTQLSAGIDPTTANISARSTPGTARSDNSPQSPYAVYAVDTWNLELPMLRKSVAVNTPMFLNVSSVFSVSTSAAFGFISARRAR